MEYNAGLLRQRESAVSRFMGITEADRENAVGLLQQYAYDVEEAVEAYMNGERNPVPLAATASSESSPAEAAAVQAPPASQIDRILNSTPVQKPSDSTSERFSGPGNSFSASSKSLPASEPEATQVTITIYGNGFTVEEAAKSRSSVSADATAPKRKSGLATFSDYKSSSGDGKSDEETGSATLRPLDDAAGREFMSAIEKHEVPRELRRLDPRTHRPIPVSITLADRRPRLYRHVPEKPSLTFSGAGTTLGGGSTNYVELGDGGAQAAGVSALVARTISVFLACPYRLLGLGPRAPTRPALRSNTPTTKLQLRLSNGRRIEAELNCDAALSDVFLLIECEMYEEWLANGGRGIWSCPLFDLTAGYPPQVVSSDRTVTLEAHSPALLGAVISQRLHPQSSSAS